MFPITRILARQVPLSPSPRPAAPLMLTTWPKTRGQSGHTSPFSLSKTPERLANAICIDGRYLATLAKLVYGAGCISTLPRTSDGLAAQRNIALKAHTRTVTLL